MNKRLRELDSQYKGIEDMLSRQTQQVMIDLCKSNLESVKRQKKYEIDQMMERIRELMKQKHVRYDYYMLAGRFTVNCEMVIKYTDKWELLDNNYKELFDLIHYWSLEELDININRGTFIEICDVNEIQVMRDMPISVFEHTTAKSHKLRKYLKDSYFETDVYYDKRTCKAYCFLYGDSTDEEISKAVYCVLTAYSNTAKQNVIDNPGKFGWQEKIYNNVWFSDLYIAVKEGIETIRDGRYKLRYNKKNDDICKL